MHLKICGVPGDFRATIGIFVLQRTKIVDCSDSRAQEELREALTQADGLI